MNKQEIINSLAKNTKIRQIAFNIAKSKGLGDDLYQHLFLVLCEYDTAKLMKAHEGKYIEFLCIRILTNSYHSHTSPFSKLYKMHGDFTEELTPDTATTNDEAEAELIRLREEYDREVKPIDDFLEQRITQENFYEVTLTKRWAEGESYRQLSARTGIPVNSIGNAIRKAINDLKDKVT